MNLLALRHEASELAFNTVTTTTADFDAAVAAKAGELQLPEPQYQSFKRDVATFRQQYAQAANADAQAETRAGAQTKRPTAAGSPVTGAPAPAA